MASVVRSADRRALVRLGGAVLSLVSILAAGAAVDLEEEARIEVAHTTARRYLAVVSTPKGDTAEGIACAELAAKAVAGLGGVGDAIGPRGLEIGGLGAIQHELRIHVGQTLFGYLHTMVEGSQSWHEIMAWMPAPGFESERAELDRVIGTFVEVAHAGGVEEPDVVEGTR